MGNCHPLKTNVNIGFASVDISRGDNFPCYPLVSHYIYIMFDQDSPLFSVILIHVCVYDVNILQLVKDDVIDNTIYDVVYHGWPVCLQTTRAFAEDQRVPVITRHR